MQAFAERASELTLVAIESRARADLGLGRRGELAGDLEALCGNTRSACLS
jgi:hypothetical protein